MSYRNPLHGLDSSGEPTSPDAWRSSPSTMERAPELIAAMRTVADLALRFGEINRTAVFHRDGVTPEDDAEHTVMLGWLAPALAERLCPDLDHERVAVYALVHDMPEVYAGDTPTLRISQAGRDAKAAREAEAVDKLRRHFDGPLPWLSLRLTAYENQADREARFVRAVDKFAPKLVHLIDEGAGLREHEVTRTEFYEMAHAQRAQPYLYEFPELLDLHRMLCDRVLSTVTFWGDAR